MFPSSERFSNAIKNSHTYASRVVVRDFAGKIIYDTDSDNRANIIGGSVTQDRSSGVFRTLSGLEMILTDYTVFDKYFDPQLGHLIQLYRGISFADGDIEYIPMGVFKLTSYSLAEMTGSYKFMATGYDLSYFVSLNVWTAPYSVNQNANYLTAIIDVLNDRATGFPVILNVPPSSLFTEATPAMQFGQGDDPWKTIEDLASAIRCEVRFDPQGVFTVTSIQSPLEAPVTLDLTGSADSVRIGNLNRSGDITDGYNGVICRASAPWLLFPVQGEAWDDNPKSKTWRGGSYGERPKIIDDALATTQAQCEAIATAELNKVIGVTEQVDFDSIVDPRREAGDIALLFDESTGRTSRLVISTLTTPLTYGTMSGTVRTLEIV